MSYFEDAKSAARNRRYPGSMPVPVRENTTGTGKVRKRLVIFFFQHVEVEWKRMENRSCFVWLL